MSVTNTPRKAGPYTGNNTDVQYTFGFKVFADSDLVVTRAVIATGAESTLVLTTDYSVTRNADQDVSPGGYITLTAALADTYTLTLTSAVPDTQPAVFTNLGGFFPAVLNNALDRLTILVQQLKETAGRSLKLPISAPPGTSTTLPAPVGSTFLGWDPAGAAIVNYSGLSSVGVSTYMAPVLSLTDAASVRTAIGAQVAGSYQAAGSYASLGANNDITSLGALASVPAVVSSAVSAGPAVLGTFRELAASATGASATVSVSADEIIVESAANAYATLRAVSLSINSAGSGANGLDTGTLATNTWYSVWVIYNGIAVAGLLSTSSTSPTMPGGYTHKARVGWIRTDSSGNKYPLAFRQTGRFVKYVVGAGNVPTTPVMAVGAQGTWNVNTPTFQGVAVGSFVPSTACAIDVGLISAFNGASQSNAMCAPNASYGGMSSTKPPPLSNIVPASPGGAFGVFGTLLLESTNIYVVIEVAGGALLACGWEDNL